ncbi:hypothetical protein K469DRAFT_687501 [Zopfia rhizophila CBS 207.26]|uniref:Uncharacterized protein n=1 Tax=Zopfia rhizophila CBS 207.26 TaxID=1314779 RepID=A0A6A6E8D5_9PEZI|nr:hypothetical protein K469DRAFT_687501 [Zopfia rhizophila CBS 207.26]
MTSYSQLGPKCRRNGATHPTRTAINAHLKGHIVEMKVRALSVKAWGAPCDNGPSSKSTRESDRNYEYTHQDVDRHDRLGSKGNGGTEGNRSGSRKWEQAKLTAWMKEQKREQAKLMGVEAEIARRLQQETDHVEDDIDDSKLGLFLTPASALPSELPSLLYFPRRLARFISGALVQHGD